MRLHKLPKMKTVTVDDLLKVSDSNEIKHSVKLALECVMEESRKFKNILVIAECNDGTLVTHRAGFTNNEIVYVTEMTKARAIHEDLQEVLEEDCEDD